NYLINLLKSCRNRQDSRLSCRAALSACLNKGCELYTPHPAWQVIFESILHRSGKPFSIRLTGGEKT
ncbi:hypothetical protein NO559_12375, partial [Dasania sp. GY-MA-18]